MKARENPFRSERVDNLRLRPVGWTWEQLDARLIELKYRGAIVGPEGCGKTTLMDNLASKLGERGFLPLRLTLTAEQRTIDPRVAMSCRDPVRLVLLDGAEQLEASSWRQFLRQTARCRGLIITSHREGLLPTLVKCHTSEFLLGQIVGDLLGDDGRQWLGTLPAELFARHNGNIRLVLRDLYEHFAEGLKKSSVVSIRQHV